MNSVVAEKVGSNPKRSSSTPALNRSIEADPTDKVTGHGHGRKCAPSSKVVHEPQSSTFKISSEEAPGFGTGFASPRQLPKSAREASRERSLQHYPKVNGEERQVTPKSKVKHMVHGTWSKIGSEDRVPLVNKQKANKDRWMGKVTDAGRNESSGWASPGKMVSLADKVKSLANHALAQRTAKTAGKPTSPKRSAGAASAA